MKKENKGITLIALIITIVVMLILVGVTLNITLGENGIISKAREASKLEGEETLKEEILDSVSAVLIDKVSQNLNNTDFENILQTELSKKDENRLITWDASNSVWEINYKGKNFKLNTNYELSIDEGNEFIPVRANEDDGLWEVAEYTEDEKIKYKIIGYTGTNLENVTIPNCLLKDINNDGTKEQIRISSIGTGDSKVAEFTGTITISNSITSIENKAFYECIGLTSVIIEKETTRIGQFAFYNCKGLTNIEMPNSITSIEEYAFFNCQNLTNMTIPSGVTRIGSWAFAGCMGITEVTIPNNVESIKEYLFYNCTKLTTVRILNSVTRIETYAFGACKKLTSITIPNNVENIASDVFRRCTGLTDIYVSWNEGEQPAGWNTDWKRDCTATVHYSTPNI